MRRLSAMSSSPATIATSCPPGPKVGGKAQPRPRKAAPVSVTRPLMPSPPASVQVHRGAFEHELAAGLDRQVAGGLDRHALARERDAVAVRIGQRDGRAIVVEHELAAILGLD